MHPTMIANRYELTELLGQSHMHQTWKALDIQQRAQVIIKTIPLNQLISSPCLGIEDELLKLSEASTHHSRAMLHHVGRDRDKLFVARPFAYGTPLDIFLSQSASCCLSRDQILALGKYLADSLHNLHQVSIIHTDLKPSNVIVQFSGSNITGAEVVDFGVRVNREQVIGGSACLVDSTSYMAPELAGHSIAAIGPWTDLYSLGALLYRCATGQPLFTGSSLSEILFHQAEFTVKTLSTKRRDLPKCFDELLQRLLFKDASERYQCAAAVVHDITTLQQALHDTCDDPQLVLGRTDVRSRITLGSFIGRAREQNNLNIFLRATGQGVGGIAFLEGESGIGKSRLLERLETDATRQGMRVLKGRALSEQGQHALHSLDEIVSTFVHDSQGDADVKTKAKRLMAEQAASICELFPQLRTLFDQMNELPANHESFAFTRNSQAFSQFLKTLGDLERPTLIIIDDGQWLSKFVVELFAHWNQLKAGGRVGVIIAFRSNEVDATHNLRQISPLQHIRLSLMPRSEVAELIESKIGSIPDGLAQRVYDLSLGNAFYIDATLRALIDSGYLIRENHCWKLDQRQFSTINFNSQLEPLLMQSLESMPIDMRRLLAAGAILGIEFELSLAMAMTGLEALDASQFRAQNDRRLLSVIDEDRYRFTHDKIREAMLRSLTSEQVKAAHSQAAESILNRHPDRTRALAYHYHNAGLHEQAYPFAWAAAQESRARFAADDAIAELQIALLGCATKPAEHHAMITEAIGDLAMSRGYYQQAEESFKDALDLVPAAATLSFAKLNGKLGELYFKTSRLGDALDHLKKALLVLGYPLPGSIWLLKGSLCYQGVVQIMRTIFRAPLSRIKKHKIPEHIELILFLLNRVSYVYWFSKSTAHCLWSHLVAMNWAEQFQPSLAMAQAYSNHAPIVTLIWPAYRRGVHYATRGLQIRREFGDYWGEGQSLTFKAVVCYSTAHFAEAIESGIKAREILNRTGDLWEKNIASYQIAASLLRLGKREEAAAEAENTYKEAVSIGDGQSERIILDVWARARPQNLPQAYLDQALAKKSQDAQAESQLCLAIAIKAISQANYEVAIAKLNEGIKNAQSSNIRNTFTAPLHVWLMTALRMHAETSPGLTPAFNISFIKEMRRVMRQARLLAWQFPGDQPHFWREKALFMAWRGKPSRAISFLERSIQIATSQGSLGEIELSLSVLRDLTGGTDSADALDRREQPGVDRAGSFSGPTPTLALSSLFAETIQHGQKIAASKTEEAVYSSLCAGGRMLFRCRTIAFVTMTKERSVQRLHGDFLSDWDKAAIEKTQLSGEPYSTSGTTQTVVCVPVLVAGAFHGCLYIENRNTSVVDTENATKAATLMSSIAGSTIENILTCSHIVANNKLKEDFLAMVSHELRTPLTVVLGWLDIIKTDGLAASEFSKVVNIMHSNTKLQVKLVSELLEFSKNTQQVVALNYATVVIPDFINELRLAYQRDAAARKISFIVNVQESATVMECDPVKLRQIVGNLLDNAMKFTPLGGRVELCCLRVDQTIVFRVSDSGIGIAADFLPFVFDRFIQESRFLTREHGGLGLGLSLVKQFTELHGGCVDIHSPGKHKGVVATCIFPITSLNGG